MINKKILSQTLVWNSLSVDSNILKRKLNYKKIIYWVWLAISLILGQTKALAEGPKWIVTTASWLSAFWYCNYSKIYFKWQVWLLWASHWFSKTNKLTKENDILFIKNNEIVKYFSEGDKYNSIKDRYNNLNILEVSDVRDNDIGWHTVYVYWTIPTKNFNRVPIEIWWKVGWVDDDSTIFSIEINDSTLRDARSFKNITTDNTPWEWLSWSPVIGMDWKIVSIVIYSDDKWKRLGFIKPELFRKMLKKGADKNRK